MRLVAALLFIFIGGATSTASAQNPYFSSQDNTLDGYLNQMDVGLRGPINRVPIRIQSVLPVTVSGIAAHPGTGVVYGVTAYNSFYAASKLITIDVATGRATVVGDLGNSRIAGLAFDPSGVLYGWDFGWDQVARIDLSSGKVSLLGASGAHGDAGGLAIDSNGTIYVAVNGANRDLRRVDPNTGLATTIATLQGAPQTYAISAMAFAPNGGLFGINTAAAENLFPDDQAHVLAISPSSGITADLGFLPAGSRGLTFSRLAPLTTLPSAPGNFACVGGEKKITCSFSKPVSATIPLPSNYILRCGTATLNSVAVANAFDSPITISGLQGATGYHCNVAAVNIDGEGPGSSRVFVVPDASLATTGSPDLNGDGASEIIVRAATPATQVGSYQPTTQKFSFITRRDAGADWQLLGTGDFLGVHRSASLLQNTGGLVKICFEFDCSFDSEQSLRIVKPGWVVEAIADMDGDGKSDIVWRYAAPNTPDTGAIFVWFMNAASIQEIKVRGGAPLSWPIVGVADIDGNGMADIVMQNPSGEIRALTGQSGRAYANVPIAVLPSGYNAVKAADFSGDGKADILLRNAAGAVSLWVLNGASITTTVTLPATDPTWTLYATGDYNGDGLIDVVWKKADGTLVLWLMNPANLAAPVVIDSAGTAPVNYSVIKP